MSKRSALKLELIPMPPSCYTSGSFQDEMEIKTNNGAEDKVSRSSWSEELTNIRESNPNKDNDGEGIDVGIRNDERRLSAKEPVMIDDSSSIEDDPRAPMMEAVLNELRRTDNVFVTEIGRTDVVQFVKKMLLSNAGLRRSKYDTCQCDCNNWDFKDENAFHYLMEILQANLLHFLKFRYYDLKRGRYCNDPSKSFSDDVDDVSHVAGKEEVSCWDEETVVQDFLNGFTKAASARYFPTRNSIISSCFQDTVIKHNAGNATKHVPMSRKIERALVRLHRRAGIFLPHSKTTEQHHEYWIALWWVASCLLYWILEPCIEITCLVDKRICHCGSKYQQSNQGSCDSNESVLSRPKQRRRLASGFFQHSQSSMANFPLELIRREIQKIGIPFDIVLMHDGPWTSNDKDDPDYVDGEEVKDEARERVLVGRKIMQEATCALVAKTEHGNGRGTGIEFEEGIDCFVEDVDADDHDDQIILSLAYFDVEKGRGNGAKRASSCFWYSEKIDW